jgi:Holliday junction DNA helicase RuvA
VIAALTGILRHKGVGDLVIDVGGVGYSVRVSLQTLAELPPEGESVSLLCHTHVREDALQLFGFLNSHERDVFELLISVSGVGPKLALTILSGMPVNQLGVAMAEGNHRRLVTIPGVGKRTAERLIVELKDRFGSLAVGTASRPPAGSAGTEHLVEALAGLGYRRQMAEKAVAQAAQGGDELPPEQLLRRALALLQGV